MKKQVYALLIILMLILLGGYYYLAFPAINIHLRGFWSTLFVVFLVLGFCLAASDVKKKIKTSKKMTFTDLKKISVLSRICVVFCVVIALVVIIGSIMGASIFRAKSYASLLDVKEYDFKEDIAPTTQVNDIALMDTASARKFGNRMIGSLSDVVSQYEVEDDYTQISISKSPMKVSSLRYASFFKWWNNKEQGIPGYVKVNPVNSRAEYVALKKGMKYVPSAYFNYNLPRHVQLAYPTKIISGYHFEVDDEGKPYYICPTMKARVGLFQGMDVDGVILCDPVSGDCKFYSEKNIPTWVDSVYDGHLLTRKYDWYGTLSGGFWNSIIGQKGCKVTTDDFGYKIIEDDVWIYTGVTSVTGDQSNIGFIMINQRTSEAKYYKVSGAEEHSAMDSAQGAIQEKGYTASFPSLINVDGQATYIMVLKDAAGLVKMYAMVNVEQYNIVATAKSQTEVFKQYRKMLATEGKTGDKEESIKTAEITVEDIVYVQNEDGVTVVYIKDTEHGVYKKLFTEDENLIKISKGDRLMITYEPMEDGIHLLQEFTEVAGDYEEESALDIENGTEANP